MAGPLSGLGGQQVPLSSPFQPGQNGNQVRGNEQQPVENRVQAQQAAAAASQKADSENQARYKAEDRAAFDTARANDRTDQRRGSLVDITV